MSIFYHMFPISISMYLIVFFKYLIILFSKQQNIFHIFDVSIYFI